MRQRGARAWLLLAPALWLALACTAAARSLAEAQDGAGVAFSPRRSLAAAAAGPDCRVVHSACKSCRNVRLVVPGGSVRKTQLICTSCDSGWRLRKGDPRFCDCAPGFFAADGATCSPCQVGRYCPGGVLANNAASTCPEGLATIIIGAKSAAQCMTTPGWGRAFVRDPRGDVTISSTRCGVGTYNMGRNANGCQRCAPGLTTRDQGATAPSDCVARPGSYVRNGAGSLCPRGAYTTEFNSDPFCLPCGSGLTTPGEGSTRASDCRVAARGFFLKLVVELAPQDLDNPAAGNSSSSSNSSSTQAEPVYAAEPCPADTYQDTENELGVCKACPGGLRTQGVGATGLEQCLAPPGMEQRPGADSVSECAEGSFKPGFNMNPCQTCGEGILTNGTGAVAIDDCFVPAGHGVITTATGVRKAVPCVQGTFGRATPDHAISRAKCIACPANMQTADQLTGTPAASGYTSMDACLNQPGWGSTQAGVSEPCPLGSWSAGQHRNECSTCASGFTTLDEGATSAAACVIKPGWTMDVARNLPRPCDQGTWGAGGSAASPFGACVACPAGFTTQQDEATSAEDCDVCEAGHGGANCMRCQRGTFSYGGGADACRPCPAGRTSARGATDDTHCVHIWPAELDAFYTAIQLSDESAWTNAAASSASEDACKAACGTGCIMFRFFVGASPPAGLASKCQLLNAAAPSGAGRVALGFKALGAGVALDYAFSYVPSSLAVGEPLSDLGAGKSAADCMAACSRKEDCVLVRMAGSAGGPYSCSLHAASLDAEWMSSYRIDAAALAGDGFVVSTTA